MKRVLGTACMAAVMCAVRAAPFIAEERHAIKPSAGAHARHASLLAKGAKRAPPAISTAAPRVIQPAQPHKASNALLMCVGIVAVWIGAATAVFSWSEGWPVAQSLFFAVDTGMSIGFGAVAEEKLRTKVFTIFHVLLGASAISGAIALFADSVVAESAGIAASEYSVAALEGAFRAADKDGN